MGQSNTVLCSCQWWLSAAVLVFVGGLSPVGAVEPIPPPPVAGNPLAPEVTAAMDHLEPLWESMKTDIVSCEAKFRVYPHVIARAGVQRDEVLKQIEAYKLGEHPEKIAEFVEKVLQPENKLFVPPAQHLFEQGGKRRSDLGKLIQVQLVDESITLSHANKQINAYLRGSEAMDFHGLRLFRVPLASRASGHRPARALRQGNLVHLDSVTPLPQLGGEIHTRDTVDWTTGILRQSVSELPLGIVEEKYFADVTTFAGGATFPRFMVRLRSTAGIVQLADFAVLEEAKLNEPIPESTFVVPKPEGYAVYDSRAVRDGVLVTAPFEAVENVLTLLPELPLLPEGF